MKCQIYISFYSLKTKYLNRFIDEWYYKSTAYIKAHSYREYCYFTPWKLYIDEFDPSSYSHMKWLDKYLRDNLNEPWIFAGGFQRCFFFDPNISDWHPPITEYRYKDIPCLKIVYNNKVIDFSEYLKKYYRDKEDKRNRRSKEWQEDCYRRMPYMLRHFRTTQEKRMKLSPEEKRNLQAEGIYIKERAKRNAHHLPNLYDDITPNIYGYCWKDISKDDRQYKTNQNSKKKQIRGEYYKSKRKKKS